MPSGSGLLIIPESLLKRMVKFAEFSAGFC